MAADLGICGIEFREVVKDDGVGDGSTNIVFDFISTNPISNPPTDAENMQVMNPNYTNLAPTLARHNDCC